MIIQIILFIMAILNIACGLASFLVSRNQHRFTAFWYLLATIFVAVWAVAIAIFINLQPSNSAIAPTIVSLIYISAPPLILSLSGYNSWHSKIGRVLVALAAIICAFIIAFILAKPELLYSGIIISEEGNSVDLNALQPLYLIYSAYMLLTTSIGISCFMNGIMAKKKRGHRIRNDLIFFIPFTITMSLIFFVDLIMPAWDYSLIWLGPIITAFANLAFFYRLIKQYVTPINTRWFVAFSYVIIAAITATIYLIIFDLIFTALFRGSEPSSQVLILNFVMFLIVILSTPVLREVWSNITSTIVINKINLPYITRKLSQYAAKPGDYRELSDVLTTHLHFHYIGLLIDGKIYNPSGSDIKLSKQEIHAITNIPLTSGLWQHPDEETQSILNAHDLISVASLGSRRQILIGKPLNKKPFSKRELTEIETILNLVAAIL